ncbi:MAG: hypothetical protein ABIP77_02980 [Candidatus Limnocylindrales bacterium]
MISGVAPDASLRLSLLATLAVSLLATLANPSAWILAIAGFLVRGGIVLVLAPIVVVPSAVGLANLVAPTLTSVVFGGISGEVLTTIVLIIAAVASWLIFGGLAAAALEVEGALLIARDDEVVGGAGGVGRPDRLDGPTRPGTAMRVLLARVIAAGPLAIALATGSIRVVAVAYRELTVPSDVAVALVVRVARGAPEAIAWIVLAWILAEIVGAMAARRIVLAGDGVIASLGASVGQIVRSPLRAVVAFVMPLAVLIAVLVPSTAASVAGLETVRASIANDAGPVAIAAWIALFVGLWAGGLVLVGMACAWRSAIWTMEAARTFGAVRNGRPGDWTASPDTATLADLRPDGADLDPR